MTDSRIDKIVLDLSNIATADELHRTLSAALGFPDYYGCNWDAFWDAITGLVEMPRKLVIIGWPELERRLPREAGLMLDCLRDLNAEYPSFGCELEFV